MSSPALAARAVNAAPVSGARVLELDILRGLAILLVLGIHSPSARGESGWLRPLDVLSHQFGWTGVDLFFVLSGYLIGGLLFSEIKKYGRLQIGRFLTRRMMRIWPAYYTLLLFVVMRMTLETGGSLSKAWSSMWPAFFHIQNFIECSRDQLWSLAVEEHFYIALPIFLWFVTRKGKPVDGIPAVPITCAVLSIGCVLLRFVLSSTTHIDVRLRTDLSFDALFFGVNLAYLRAYRPEILQAIAKRRKLIMPLAWLLFVPAVIDTGMIRRTIGCTGVYLGYALYLICFVLGEPGKLAKAGLGSRPVRLLAIIGTGSYSIYLWHRDTSWWAYELALSTGHSLGLPGELTWALHTLAYIVASIVGGMILGHVIETPALRLRDRLFPSRTATVALPGSAPGSAPEVSATLRSATE